jgi:hypothetical protein
LICKTEDQKTDLGPEVGLVKKGGVRVIFSLHNVGEEKIFISNNIPSSVNEKTFINKFHVSNAEASLSELMSC